MAQNSKWGANPSKKQKVKGAAGKIANPSWAHPKYHEILGVVALAGAAVLTLLGWLVMGDIPPRMASFNVSLLLVGAGFVLRKFWASHPFMANPAEIERYYSFGLIGLGLFLGFGLSMWGPATINFLFGGLILRAQTGMKYTSGARKTFWFAVLILGLFAMIYMVPWGQVPDGPVKTAGTTIKAGMDATVVPLLKHTGNVIEDCTGRYGMPMLPEQQCQEKFNEFINFLRTHWLGQQLVNLILYFTEMSGMFAGNMECLSSGDTLYDETEDVKKSGETEYEDCWQTPGGNSTDSSGSNGGVSFTYDKVQVGGSTAQLWFSKDLDESAIQASDFSASTDAGDVRVIEKRDVSGNTVKLGLSGTDPLINGDIVTISISGAADSVDGDVLKSGKCAAPYNEVPDCRKR